MSKGKVTSWIWDRLGRTPSQIERGVREVQVTIEVSSSETHDFIPRLMHCLTSDTEETKQVWLLRNYKGTEPDGTYILSSKEVALECGEGWRKRQPTNWY